MALDENNTNNPELEEVLEPTDQLATTEEKIKESERSGAGIGSIFGILISVPVGIYSYINSPDRYSAERLEKEAQKKATKEVRKIVKSSKKDFTEDEREVLHEKAKREYYDNYATYHEKRARKLAQDPKTNNPFLKRALSYKDARNAIAKATAEAQKDKSRQFSPITGKESFYNDARAAIAKANEKAQKNKSAQFSTLPPREETPSGSSNMRTPSVSGLSMPGGGVKPTTPSVPGKATPKIPGNKRGLPHLPKPGLPGIPNPIQNIRTLAMFFNPTNIIIFSLIGIFISVFFIVFTFGGGGGGATGGGVAGRQPPSQPAPPIGQQSAYTFVALGDSLTAWPCDPVTFGCVDSNPWGSYRFTGKPWPTYLTTDDPNLNLFYNASYPAQTTAYMLTQEPGVLSTYKPDVLFVLGGTNDKDGNTITNLNSIIAAARNTSSIKYIILLTIPHQCPIDGKPFYFTVLNNNIKNLENTASNLYVIDIDKALTCGADYQADGLHFTNAGARAVADYIDGQIKARNILPTQGTFTQTPSEAYYCQGDGASWANTTYDSGTYATAGCGPTSMAMILSSYGSTQTPVQVGAMFANSPIYLTCGSNPACPNTNFGYCTCQGTWSPNIKTLTTWLNSIGFQTAGVSVANGSFDFASAEKYLEPNSNYLLYVGVTNWPLLHGPGGHSFVVESIDPTTESLTIRDPANCTKKIYTINQETAGEDARGNSQALDWIFAIPIKLK